MKDKIREYIDFSFRNAPNTLEAMELKDEITNDVIMRYEKLISKGLNEDLAFSQAIANIGDIDDLISELKKGDDSTYIKESEDTSKNFEKLNILMGLGVGLILLSPVPAIIFNDDKIGPALLFLLVAAGVGLMVYVGQSKKRIPTSITTDFKEYRKNSETQHLRNIIRGIIGTTGVIVYFLISFLTGAWYITWIIFIIIGLCDQLADLFLFSTKDK